MGTNTMKTTLAIATATLGVLLSLAYGVQDQERVEQDTSKFMQQKLDFSRDILEGLANEDYEQITKAAQDLMLLSHESDWNVLTTPEYLKASSNFRETVQRLRDVGRENNLDGATIAFFEVTASCVRCHKQLRGDTPRP